ncbi:MAG: hypothetical protein LBU27_09795 [Candidatus Peribacteria bacterium]|nr:hypothetical protein [Candidatus Peribacteria bacterium]
MDEHPEYPRYAFTRQFYHKYGFETIESFNDEDVVILKMQKPLQRKSDTSTSFDNVVHDGELV